MSALSFSAPCISAHVPLFSTIPSTPRFHASILFVWASFPIGYSKHGVRARGVQDPAHLQHHPSGKRPLDHRKHQTVEYVWKSHISFHLLPWEHLQQSSSQYFIFVASGIFRKKQFDYSGNSKDPANGGLNNFFIL